MLPTTLWFQLVRAMAHFWRFKEISSRVVEREPKFQAESMISRQSSLWPTLPQNEICICVCELVGKNQKLQGCSDQRLIQQDGGLLDSWKILSTLTWQKPCQDGEQFFGCLPSCYSKWSLAHNIPNPRSNNYLSLDETPWRWAPPASSFIERISLKSPQQNQGKQY